MIEKTHLTYMDLMPCLLMRALSELVLIISSPHLPVYEGRHLYPQLEVRSCEVSTVYNAIYCRKMHYSYHKPIARA